MEYQKSKKHIKEEQEKNNLVVHLKIHALTQYELIVFIHNHSFANIVLSYIFIKLKGVWDCFVSS